MRENMKRKTRYNCLLLSKEKKQDFRKSKQCTGEKAELVSWRNDVGCWDDPRMCVKNGVGLGKTVLESVWSNADV